MQIDYDAELNQLMENPNRVADHNNYMFIYHAKIVSAKKKGHTPDELITYDEWFCNFLNERGDGVLKPSEQHDTVPITS